MMEERRSDPEALLAWVKSEDERERRGKLKIFFGAAPGVGKTYAMLYAARKLAAEGVEVAVGLVETHGRVETEALLKGLDIIPRRRVEYRGTTLTELDIDAVLARRPALALIDELAHTNAPGSRHKKRWQDVFEILSAGIDVLSTLNVQHVESLNDVVAQITSVKVTETLPDSVLERADEIELVDLPPDELLRRLNEGKVYMQEVAERARHNFFRKGNLLALRELALRRTAERVDAQMQNYRTVTGVRDVWPATERILVCVGPNPYSIRLIRAAKRMAAGLRAEWIAANVSAPSKVKPSESDLRQLAEHMRLSENLGAETVTLSGHSASDEILNFARDRNVTKIIVGKPTHPRWKDKLFGSFLDEMVRGSGDIDVYVISGDTAEPMPRPAAKTRHRGAPTRHWLSAAAMVGVCTAAAELMSPYVAMADLAMVYLIGVVFMAAQAGKTPSLIATVLGILAFDFFFVPPLYTLRIGSPGYLITFVVMFVIAYIISSLTLRVRNQAVTARQRERRTAALFGLSRKLVHERGIQRLSDIAIKHITEVFSCRAVVLTLDVHGRLAAAITGPGTFALDPKESGVAQWAFDHSQKAGLGTDTLAGAGALYLPLAAGAKTVGVLGILPEFFPDGFFALDQLHMLESFADQTALAIDRALMAEETQQALLKAETETLRNTLLSSVSHNLRTPLAAITGAATTLLHKDVALDAATRRELAQTIREGAEHLDQIIRNVLDMTKIEAGAIAVRKEWQHFEEIVGAALTHIEEKLGDRVIKLSIPEELPLAPFDPLLIEQVLLNLLDNAVKYTPYETPIDILARATDDELIVEFGDRGPGIPPGDEERIFGKFERGLTPGGGIGLGLTICRAIIAAHGGRIQAENRHGGGALFRFTLPIEGEPPRQNPDDEKY
jgi:two-component system sensor histidine kinase KdpD